MQRVIDLRWLYTFIVIYIIAAGLAFSKEIYFALAFPAVAGVILCALYLPEKLYFFVVACTPLAVNLTKTGIGIGISVPTEPLIFGMMLLFLVKGFTEGNFNRNYLFHPVSILIIISLCWMFFTSLTSSMFVVSIKQFLARLAFITVFYFFSLKVFKSITNIYLFVWLYTISMLVVIVYTISRHAMGGFSERVAHSAMQPFYNDHTAYAAALALFLPVVISFSVNKSLSFLTKFFALLTFIILFIATVLSYTRAAWLGIITALLAYFVFLFRIKTWMVLTVIFSLIAGYFIYQSTLMYKFGKTKQYSSTNYKEHVKSITNIKTDASNVERLNRWSCAVRMFKERPLVGWGPGTYQFQYAPFQKTSERSTISTNAGDRGNSHSEYLGPLCEQGILGALIFIILGIIVIVRSSRLIYTTKVHEIKLTAIGILLGLITYWIHGFMNDFLDTDKASVPFWAFIAALVSLEMMEKRKLIIDN